MRKHVTTILVSGVMITFGGYRPAVAGMCISGQGFYLECLEGKNPTGGLEEKCPEASDCFYCVGNLNQQLQRWASDREARHMREFRDSPYRDRIVMVAQKYLDDPDVASGTKQAAAQALAVQGVGKAGTHDVFAILTRDMGPRYPPNRWYVLAALGDTRTVEVARDEYARLKRDDTGSDPWAHATLLDIIDCLYHIPDGSALKLLREMGQSETDAELRDEINRVVWKRSNRK